jgi:thioredoxin reductase
LPTGDELVEGYLEPLAAIPEIAAGMRYSSRVVTVTRAGHDKVRTGDRSALPFLLRVDTPVVPETRPAAAVIDASGTWGSFNPLGSGGVPAEGEVEAADRISYRIPDLSGAERRAYAGRRVLVVGSGHSAANAILDLVSLAGSDAATSVVWAIRGSDAERVFGVVGDGRLPARQSLGARLRSVVDAGRVTLHTGFSVDRIRSGDGDVGVRSLDGREIRAHRVIAVTGQRPELGMTRELRLDLDARLEAPRRLAPLIDPDVHTCGTVEPHGHEVLGHPEPRYFTAGIKSYGRAPTFLTITGYQQVRSIVAALAGPGAEGARTGHVPASAGVAAAAAGCSC